MKPDKFIPSHNFLLFLFLFSLDIKASFLSGGFVFSRFLIKSFKMGNHVLKLINNSSSQDKGNHNREGGIDFYDFTSPFTPWALFWLRRYIKHSRQCFIGYPNTSNFVKNTPLRVVFSTLFSVFGYPNETLSLVFDILPKNEFCEVWTTWTTTAIVSLMHFLDFTLTK